jgi:hypothetical protein
MKEKERNGVPKPNVLTTGSLVIIECSSRTYCIPPPIADTPYVQSAFSGMKTTSPEDRCWNGVAERAGNAAAGAGTNRESLALSLLQVAALST